MSAFPYTDLRSVMSKIGSVYSFVPEKYPDLRAITSHAGRMHFAVRHSALHMMKSASAVAAQAEIADHGGQMNFDELRIATAKAAINALNLANALGIKAEDLVDEMYKEVK